MNFTWRKLSAAQWEDVWPERLSEYADRLAITALPGAKTIRLEIFALTPREADRLKRAFGGSVVRQTRDWLQASAPRQPINIRGRLDIITDPREQRAGRPALIIPAGMAFGTGEHATTVSCLRLLADFAAQRTAPWAALDLGCGSGILALAAKQFGARRVLASDFDPACVRIARENARTNALRITVQKLDVLAWEPEQTWELITANLYSTILIGIAPKLARALASDGTLIFSGVLRTQEREVAAAFRQAGLRMGPSKRQGKWVAGIAKRARTRTAAVK
jgi:ribosomal protein L11 methyltransferase